MTSKIDFKQLTGQGIRIGIVDSGYSPNQCKINIGDCIDFSVLNEQKVDASQGSDYRDEIGHGTACAGIIFKKAPEAQIFPVKIFKRELVSDDEKLAMAIEWCVKQGVHLINLSLGTTATSNLQKLKAICELAFRNHIFIIAATSNDEQESFPASFKHVFGVTGGKISGKYDYYFDGSRSVQCIARGDRQRLDWLNGQKIFMGGTSFAAPHMTGIIALILQKYPGISYQELSEMLTKYSLKEEPKLANSNELYQGPAMPIIQNQSALKLSEIHQQNDISWIQKAVIFPYNKEMHSLVRFRNLLSFEIKNIVDVVGKKTIGKDSGQVIGAEESGIVVQKQLEYCLEESDTIILGYLNELSRIKRRDMIKEVLELALEHEKNVYSLSPIIENKYTELLKQFKNKNLYVHFPLVTYSDFKMITNTFDWRTPSRKPVIGVFGTSPQQGKFTAQLALRQELIKEGYRVGQLGTEHQSALFGFDFTFPNGYDGHQSIQIPVDLHITLLHSVMTGIENKNPHITIVGGQSGIIPYNFAERSQGYTLSSLIMILGTIPDAYILVVNSIDEFDYIHDNINVLKGLGKGETILLVFSDKRKDVINTFGRSSVVQHALSGEEVQATIKKFEDRFGIPATEIVSRKGRKKMLSIVENYFSDDQ